MYFDDKAKDWDKDPKKIERAGILANEISDFLKNGKRLNAFEFGCGTGLVSFFLKDFFQTITLADNSEGMINVLKEKLVESNICNFHPILVDMLKDDLQIEKHDVVYTLMTMHHIMELDKMVSVFNSILNKNGYLCIADLVTEDGSFHYKHPGFDGHNGFDKDELTAILVKNGFTVVLYKIFFVIEKQMENETKKFPLFLMIGKKN